MEALRNFGKGLGTLVGSLIVIALVGLILFRMMAVKYVENYQLGYAFDSRTGQIEILNRPGYFIRPPIVVSIHTVDMRPMQVCISAIQRVLNCKLVQFDKKGLELFLSWHGRNDYEGPSSSTTSTASTTTHETNFASILKNYAYEGSGKSYPFLTVLRELKNEENVAEAPK